ncbi:MAG TPA: FimV/HubP family polar landmark protein [Steroidobacteraceae bacterium]|nr:FimV/HubP family polar landmark protein [Steroidobacteraceae bacterium]
MKRMGLARVLLALLLLPGISHALGLGDVHLNSPLNAPLDAEIELVNATPEDLATLEAKLASKETFERYGLDWPQFMSTVTVTRDRSASGGQVLRIRSTETVTEPFLTLLIEASWARGRLVREYTVLLDPPVFAPNSVAAAQPRPAMPSVGGAEASGTISRPAQPEPQTAAPVAAGGGDSYEVQRGDSLSAIARRLSASTGARTDQLMVSIYRGNSGAFEGDMNRLRAGSVLRIPSGEEIAAVSPAEASGEVRRLAGAWAGAGAASGTGRLRLVPPSDSAASPGASSGNAAEVDALQGRVRELEGELTESKRLLELRNTELADLQAKLAASQQQPVAAQPAPTQTPVEQPLPQPEAVTPAPDAAAPTPSAAAPEPAPTPAETPATEPAQPTPSETAAPAEGEEGPSLIDSLLGYWWVLAAGLLVVLGLLFVKSRTKRKTAEFDDSLGRLADHGEDRLAQPMDSLSDTGRMRAPNMGAIPEDILVEESGTHRALQETQDIPLAPTVRTDETISSETAINLDQGDPLSEADFHMAYGLYDQAADLVRIAIQREPDRRDLKLKLLEVFFVWGNKEQFLTMARELSDSRSESGMGEWEKIVIMGKQIAPEDSMFSDGGAGSSVGVDLNLDAGGSGRVDFDPFDVSARMDVTGGGNADAVDLDLGNALRDPDATGEGLMLPNNPASGQTTREMTVKMTQAGSESPTVEQPALRPLDEPTIREKVEGAMRRKLSSDQTAELALDDLGLELGSLEQTDSQIGMKPVGGMPRGPDSNAPTMVAGLDENSQRLLAAAAARHGMTSGDDSQLTEHGASGTWFLTERELGGDVDLTKGRALDPNSTASMAKFEMPEAGFDISSTSRLAAIDRENLDFPIEPTQQQPVGGGRGKVDLDIGNGFDMPGSPTEELAVPDLEPVTLSEVGTKLDLARAYVDMGDPDGARNILNEVLSEGSASQKQEAQRLLESLPG